MEYKTYNAKTLMCETFSRIEIESKNPKGISGYSTDFFCIDSFTGGFRPGQLITIGSYEFSRKAFPFCLLHNFILKNQIPCALFTFEEKPENVGIRLLSLSTGIPYRRLRLGMFTGDKLKKVDEAAQILAGSHLITVECALMDFEQLCNSIRKQCALNELKVIFINTLNFIPLDKEAGSKHERILSVLQKLRKLAIELDVCIIIPFYIDDSEKEKSLEKKIHFLQILSDVTMILKRTNLIQKDSPEKSYNLSIITELSRCELEMLMNISTLSFRENN